MEGHPRRGGAEGGAANGRDDGPIEENGGVAEARSYFGDSAVHLLLGWFPYLMRLICNLITLSINESSGIFNLAVHFEPQQLHMQGGMKPRGDAKRIS